MNLPNFLTISRIFFVPLLVAALVEQDVLFHIGRFTITNDWLALAIFLVAAGTDLLDGYLARRLGQITTIGTLLDPIADKLLISSALIALVQVRAVPGWLVILLIGREFAVSGLRSIAAAEGYTIKASDLGKTKTTAQVLGIGLLLMSMRHAWLSTAAHWSMGAVVFFSLLSALDYFWKFWRRVDIGTKQRRRREVLVAERHARLAAFREKRMLQTKASQGKGFGGVRGTT
ncbi:MAG: CDP-diacylglycerol--glycerol-3-phosphate 3-phosphatidyltransferase [Acidobacteriota bacterium]|nr:CDP-diacylglycerol--glycerol-3-phosphate 3-phosphatidyltransferase [Acidobacteriota bacterium]